MIDTTLKEYAYLSVSIKKLLAELKADESGIQSVRQDPNNGRGRNSSMDETVEAFETRLPIVEEQLGEQFGRFQVNGDSPPLDELPVIPEVYALYQNYTNPFNPVTEIRFDLPEKANIAVKVFNSLSQLVATLVNEERPAGAYRVSWDASSAASGMYFYQLKAGNFVDAKKMVLIRCGYAHMVD